MAAVNNEDATSEAGSFGEWEDNVASEVQGFLGSTSASPGEAWSELHAAAEFDFLAWLKSLEGERMYAYIKLVNFIRNLPDPVAFKWATFTAGDLASDDLLMPKMQDDGMLEAYCLVESDDEPSDKDED